jgi:hypothetical protein
MQGDGDYERKLEIEAATRKITLLWYKEKQRRLDLELEVAQLRKQIAALENETDSSEGYRYCENCKR